MLVHLKHDRTRQLLEILGSLLLLMQTTTVVFAQKSGAKETGSVLHLTDRIVSNSKLVTVEGSNWGFQVPGKVENELIKLGSITRWGNWRGVIGKQAIWMSDGSWLAGEIQLDTKDQVQLQSRWLQLGSIPTKSIRAMLISPTASLADWINIQQTLLNYSGESDSIWLRDRKQIVGIIQAESLVSSSNSVEILVANQPVAIPLEQISLIAFSPTLQGPIAYDPTEQIGLQDGTLMSCVSITSKDNRIQIVSQAGIKTQSLDFPDDFLSSITYLSHPTQQNVQRLDQLKPASFKHIADSTLEFSLGVNKDVYGQPLTSGSRRDSGIVFHGLAMHSSSQVAFRWDGSSAKLLAEVQLAANAPASTETICKVLLARDGQLATAKEFTLSKASEAESKQLLEIDIAKSQLIVLVVEKSTQSQFGDHVLWLDPRIVSP